MRHTQDELANHLLKLTKEEDNQKPSQRAPTTKLKARRAVEDFMQNKYYDSLCDPCKG